jgi:poly-gamma-glutamate system protein
VKRLYWRPQRISHTVLVLISVFAVSGALAVENFKRKVKQPYYSDKIAAAKIAQKGFKILQEERLNRRLPIDKATDPAQSGLIGEQITPVTTNLGSLGAKQTSVNPNLAAVIVEYLRRAGVSSGDVVAVGYSGSFPGVNVNVLAALHALKLKPIIISSAASSQWGANLPEYLWLDMEKTLLDHEIVPFRSVAASLGGIEDKGMGLTRKGRSILEAAINQHGLQFIQPQSFAESVEIRMQIYRERGGDFPIKAYVNVGGGTTSVGTKIGKRAYKPGLNRKLPPGADAQDSIMSRFIQDGVPVIHLVKIERIAEQYGLRLHPTVAPPVGEGLIYYRDQYNLWLAGGVLLAIIALLYAFVRSDVGFRMLRPSASKTGGTPPEPMV